MEVSQHTEEAAILVCLGLMVSMMITFTLGRRAGIRHRQIDPEGARNIGGAVEGAIFALLGLLIAFTFSGAADRFEARRALITDEANAIDTAWLRIDLLNEADQPALRDALRQYFDARLSFYAKLPDEHAAEPDLVRAEQLQSIIWLRAVDAVPRGAPGAMMMVVPALNQMFDIATLRQTALVTHPPLPIYGLLMILALVCSSLAGHHTATSARHPLVLPMMFAGISAVAIYVILDLEYPRAGFIRIDSADAVLHQLRAHMS